MRNKPIPFARFANDCVRYELRLKKMQQRQQDPDCAKHARLDSCGNRGSAYWMRKEYDDATQGY